MIIFMLLKSNKVISNWQIINCSIHLIVYLNIFLWNRSTCEKHSDSWAKVCYYDKEISNEEGCETKVDINDNIIGILDKYN